MDRHTDMQWNDENSAELMCGSAGWESHQHANEGLLNRATWQH